MMAPLTAGPRKPTLLHDRYELLDEMPHVTGGRLFRARDLAFGEMVGVKQLGEDCGLPPDERQQFEETVRHLQCLPHPRLLHLESFDAAAGLLVQEWVPGISLLDLLRRRRAITMNEALRLLAPLPATLDFLGRAAVPIPRPLLRRLFVHCEEPGAAEGLGAMPVEQWPPFTLKLSALSVRGLIAPAAGENHPHTVFVDPREPREISESYGPREFARLLYELLGGRVHELAARRYSPIGALREAGNALVRRTLFAMPHADCQTLWQDLIEAQPEPPRGVPAESPPARRQLFIPEPLLAAAQPGGVLRLEPLDPEVTPICLVARSRFNLGRSPEKADFLARMQPENDANIAVTNRLSRIHAHLRIGAVGLEVRDGSGHGPSLNGSTLDGEPLAPDPPTPLARRAWLQLGEEYLVELIHVAPAAPRPWEIANIEGWAGPPENGPTGALEGAVVARPAKGLAAARHAAWLFTEIGFGLDAADRLVWDTRGRRDSPAAFHFYRGCFWLRNCGHAPLACHDLALERDAIAPLVSGATVRLGARIYRVEIE